MEKRLKERFNLSKIKLLKNEGLDVFYTYQVMDGASTYVIKDHVESPCVPHPDLVDIVKKLNTMVARIYSLTFFREILVTEEFKATKKQAELSERYYQAILDKIRVTGVAISGSDKTRGAIITATFLSESNVPMALNTHLIKFNHTRYGFEQDLEQACDELKDEAFLYVFENKKAQLDIFPSGDE